MDDMRFYVLFNSISVISEIRTMGVLNERLCAMEPCLWLRRFHVQRGSNSVGQRFTHCFTEALTKDCNQCLWMRKLICVTVYVVRKVIRHFKGEWIHFQRK